MFPDDPTWGHTTMRGYPRFEAYLPVQCTAVNRARPHPGPLAGKTQSVSAGGFGLLLPETLPLRTPVMIQVYQKDALRGSVVWVGQDTPTLLGTTIPHGVAFERAVDPALVRQWVYQARRQAHARVSVRFDVEYTQEGVVGQGTCLNVARGGMFIATERPGAPGTEVMLHFTLPGLSCPLSLLARVAWMCEGKTGPSAVSGMGVQFLDPKPSEAALIGALVDRLHDEASAASDSSGSLPSFV